MINKELDNIMLEYVDKASDFCKNYEKSILEKGCSPFSHGIEKVFENLENELWRLKRDTEELLYISNDRMITCEIDKRNNYGVISLDVESVRKELDSVQQDLNAAHLCFLNKCGANIAEGLAEKWHENALCAGFEVIKSAMKAGAENDN